MDKIYICDVSHTSHGIISKYFPYTIGCLKSYFHEYGEQEAKVRLFEFPEKLAAEPTRETPTMVGFSNYMWNHDIS